MTGHYPFNELLKRFSNKRRKAIAEESQIVLEYLALRETDPKISIPALTFQRVEKSTPK